MSDSILKVIINGVQEEIDNQIKIDFSEIDAESIINRFNIYDLEVSDISAAEADAIVASLEKFKQIGAKKWYQCAECIKVVNSFNETVWGTAFASNDMPVIYEDTVIN